MSGNMARKSISKRIKITKNKKVRRRARGLGHAKSNKRTPQRHRKKGERTLDTPHSKVRGLLH